MITTPWCIKMMMMMMMMMMSNIINIYHINICDRNKRFIPVNVPKLLNTITNIETFDPSAR